MKKVFLVVLAVLALTLSLSQIDDGLSDDSVAMLNRINIQATSESYLYLLGIFSEKGQSPIQTGKMQLEEIRKLEADKDHLVKDYPKEKKLNYPQGKAFCKSWEKGCIKYLFSEQIDTTDLLNNHQELISRVNHFLQFDEFTTLAKPTVRERIPPYQYLTAAERIKTLYTIKIYKNGSTEKAINNLLTRIAQLRKALALQDTIIGKSIMLLNISEVIDVLSVILSEEKMKGPALTRLTDAEKSFYMLSAREFANSYHMYKELDRTPDLIQKGGNFPGWITRILFKPNMTTNAIAADYYELEQLAKLSPNEFAKYIKTAKVTRPSTSKLRNYIGHVVTDFPLQKNLYISKFNDLDVKISLYNQVHHTSTNKEQINNPYFGIEKAHLKNEKLCLKGPLQDNYAIRCLKMKM